MSAYKKLNKQDAYITTYVAHKQWAMSGSQFSTYGITNNNYVQGVALNSLQQLYYPTKISGSAPSSSFDYYPQTTLHQSQSRELTTGSAVINVPKTLFGTAIKPKDGFELSIQASSFGIIRGVVEDYIADDYLQPYETFGRIRNPIDIIFQPTVTSYNILDDGEGQLYVSGSSPRKYVGDIIYPHGMIIVTNPAYASLLQNALGKKSKFFINRTVVINLQFKSSQPIFTHNYHCKVRESEYNFTYNPSALSSSLKTIYDNTDTVYRTDTAVATGELNSNVTGSTFQPYITTVGLYNDANELIAVGKTNRPVPKSANTEMTIIVKIDI
jgi:hypothetical protein